MHLVVTVAVLMAVVIAVAAASHRLDIPAPLALVAIGAAASFVPFFPEVELSAELALVGFLPPLLYSAALQTSLVDFNANRRAILLLSIGLVAFTTAVVGVVVHAVVPGIDWPAAFALGAVVAPPDAVAATAIGRRIGLPRNTVTILEGESLLNDATALVALRTAIGASLGAVSFLDVSLDFVRAAVGGVAVGLLVFVVVGWLRKRVTDPVLDTSVSLVTPFAAYVVAESFHGSGVLAVVIAGLALGHQAPVLQTASSRIAERLNWRTISFLLENLVFLLIGLQFRSIVEAVVGEVPWTEVVAACVATLAAVVVARFVWVYPARYLLVYPGDGPHAGEHPSWAKTTVLGWAGMRGVVTLAAAFVIPEDFAERDLLILIALFVTAGTLFLQGSTLPWLVRRLGLVGPDARGDALTRAALFQEASAAGTAWLDEHAAEEEDLHGTVEKVRMRAEQRDLAAWERVGGSAPGEETPSEAYARLRRQMLQAEREKVLEVRSSGRVAHEVIADVLTALDVEESMLADHGERRDRESETDARLTGGTGTPPACEHLAAAPVPEESVDIRVCEACVREGTTWVHLRQCLTCGNVACCDSSPRRHATGHFRATTHPVIRSAEPGEVWRWCFVDEQLG
nr:Na+/H+ antiporter [Nocardioides mesophilus]